MKNIFLTLAFTALTTLSFGQDIPKEYDALIKKADSLFNQKNYDSSAFAYSEAFKAHGSKALTNHRYNAACAWALAAYPDSSFHNLNILATKDNYSNYAHIATDADFNPLHEDSRWKPLLEIIKQNKKIADEKWDLKCSNNDIQPNKINSNTNPEVESYKLDIKIDVKSRTVDVEGYVNIDFHNQDSINFILWRNTKIHEIKYKKRNLAYTFDTISKSPIIYIPNGGKITLINPEKSIRKQSFYFKYDCDMHDVSGWGKSFTDDWIEIGFYTAWYPVNLESKNFVSMLQISIDEPYQVSGSGIINKKGAIWEINHNWSIFDNVIIASKKLKSKKIQNGTTTIETVYTTFPEANIDSVLLTCKDVLNFYKNIYGLQNSDSAYLKFVICPVEGIGGYSRKNYISLKANRLSTYLIQGVAHEIAHFWWNKADVDTWQDWLNESYAEYSMLAYIKQKFGENVFNTYIDAYRVNISKSCPIWGIDRATPEAYSALYEKGSILLYDLEQKIGNVSFLKFLRLILHYNIKTTNEFLEMTEKELGVANRNWIEMRLKAKNDER